MTGSQYQEWVTALRLWAADCTIDLSGLPPLQVDSLPPDAYARLMAHLGAAIQTMMDDFSTRFSREISAAASEFEIARTLVGLRAHLARRIQLARHPGLPREIQSSLLAGAERDLTRLQAQLEEVLTGSSSNYRSDRSAQERMLRVVRENSLTAIIAPGFPIESLFSRSGSFPVAQAAPVPAAARVPIPSHSGVVRRRVLSDNPGAAPTRNP